MLLSASWGSFWSSHATYSSGALAEGDDVTVIYLLFLPAARKTDKISLVEGMSSSSSSAVVGLCLLLSGLVGGAISLKHHFMLGKSNDKPPPPSFGGGRLGGHTLPLIRLLLVCQLLRRPDVGIIPQTAHCHHRLHAATQHSLATHCGLVCLVVPSRGGILSPIRDPQYPSPTMPSTTLFEIINAIKNLNDSKWRCNILYFTSKIAVSSEVADREKQQKNQKSECRTIQTLAQHQE